MIFTLRMHHRDWPRSTQHKYSDIRDGSNFIKIHPSNDVAAARRWNRVRVKNQREVTHPGCVSFMQQAVIVCVNGGLFLLTNRIRISQRKGMCPHVNPGERVGIYLGIFNCGTQKCLIKIYDYSELLILY